MNRDGRTGSNSDISEESHLIDALKNGDRDAFTLIYQQYWYPMFLVAYRKLQDREAAEELIQDIFTKLWKDREKVTIHRLPHYLFASVRYEVIDLIRSRVIQENYREYYREFIRSEHEDTKDTVLFNDLMTSVDFSLEMLPEKTQEVFRLSRFENLPVATIAGRLGLSEKAVEYHLTKALKSMRLYLKEHFIGLLLAFHFMA